MTALYQSSLTSLALIHRGKVRDNYALGEDRMLIVTTDRLSAFDVVLSEPIPDKGRVLNALALFWFDKLADIVPNHLTGVRPETVVDATDIPQIAGRSMVVKRLKPILVEAVVRGYLAGSGWSDYQRTGAVCGVPLPAGLVQAAKLDEPIFTPAAKAELGEHDENISFDEVVARYGAELAGKIRETSLALYRRAADYGLSRGVIIADTKFEFGTDDEGNLYLMDEVLTPDSSRFWPADQYRTGMSPPSFDKQFVRDHLESVPGWDKRAPAPLLPAHVINATTARYREAYEKLTGKSFR